MMRRLAALTAIMLAGCSPNFDRFAQLCRDKGRLIVHDQARWGAYLQGLNADHRKYGDRTRPSSPYLILFGTEGFEQLSDFGKGKADVRRSRPYRNNYHVTQNGNPVATIVNYHLSWSGFETTQSVDCIHNYPEIYGIRARPLPLGKTA
jgi:hypothetical protein